MIDWETTMLPSIYITEEERGNSRSPVLMWVESAGREGEMEASHVYRHSEPGLERHL